MDIKVDVEGVLREVCGVTEATTCEEIIIKLAEASNLPGFYTLVAFHRGGEDTLSADERMVDFFRRIKEKPTKIQFILRRLEAPPRPTYTHSQVRIHQPGLSSRSHNRILSGNSQLASTNDAFYTDGNESQRTAGQQEHTFRPAVTFEAKQPPSDATPSGDTFVYLESDEYEQLQDQLANQEREVELNRIRLYQLDKEIAELEHANRLNVSVEASFIVGPAAELAQLSATPWPQLLETNRSQQAEMIKERERYQRALERVNVDLDQIQQENLKVETTVVQQLDRLLTTLDATNAQRRQLLRSLSPSTSCPRPSASAKADGVPV